MGVSGPSGLVGLDEVNRASGDGERCVRGRMEGAVLRRSPCNWQASGGGVGWGVLAGKECRLEAVGC